MGKLKLVPYQEEGLNRVLDEPCFFLFMEMGTGKTPIAIKAIEERYLREEATRVIIWVPNILKYNWSSEIKRFLNLSHSKYAIHIPEGKNRGKKGRDQQLMSFIQDNKDKLQILIVNFDKARVMEKSLSKFKPQFAVIDEVHSLRNRGAAKSRTICRLTRGCSYRLGLTGTPIVGGPEDLYMQYNIIRPKTLGTSYREFEERYLIKGGYMGYDIVGYKNQDEIKSIMKETSYKVKLSQVCDMPPIQHIFVPSELESKAQKSYDGLMENMVAELDEPVTRKRIKMTLKANNIEYHPRERYFSLLHKAEGLINTTTCDMVITQRLRLQQICGGFLTLDSGESIRLETEKLSQVKSIIEGEEGPTIIFCQFIAEIEQLTTDLKKAFPKKRVEHYRDKNNRDIIYQDFQKGKVDVLILQNSSGSVGLNLQRATSLIFYSQNFNYDDYYQAIFRIYRRGQTKPTRVYYLQAKNTVDEDIYSSLMEKKKLASSFI